MAVIKNIIFDFGGVILKHRGGILEEFISKIFSIPLEQAYKIWQENKSDLFTGKTTSREFLLRLKEELNSDLTRGQLLEMWKNLYIGEANDINQDLLNLAENLKPSYNVILFTDTIDVHDEYNRQRDIYRKFDRVFKSLDEGYAKTDKDAFKNLLSKIEAEPEECVFIDDLEPNVEVAESLGIKGIIFKNNNQLKKELKNLLKQTSVAC